MFPLKGRFFILNIGGQRLYISLVCLEMKRPILFLRSNWETIVYFFFFNIKIKNKKSSYGWKERSGCGENHFEVFRWPYLLGVPWKLHHLGAFRNSWMTHKNRYETLPNQWTKKVRRFTNLPLKSLKQIQQSKSFCTPLAEDFGDHLFSWQFEVFLMDCSPAWRPNLSCRRSTQKIKQLTLDQPGGRMNQPHPKDPIRSHKHLQNRL